MFCASRFAAACAGNQASVRRALPLISLVARSCRHPANRAAKFPVLLLPPHSDDGAGNDPSDVRGNEPKDKKSLNSMYRAD